MKQLFKAMPQAFSKFARDEEGAQIIEYALIIAVVSLALIGAMQALAETSFDTWITNVGNLLTQNDGTSGTGGGAAPPAQ